MYKNAEKQKEASKEAMRRMRAKGITKGITSKGITVIDEQPDVILEDDLRKATARLDLHPDIIARIDAIANSPEDRARRIAGAEAYAKMFSNKPVTIILPLESSEGKTGPQTANVVVEKIEQAAVFTMDGRKHSIDSKGRELAIGSEPSDCPTVDTQEAT